MAHALLAPGRRVVDTRLFWVYHLFGLVVNSGDGLMASQSNYSPKTVERICRLVAEGQTLRQIEAKIGVPMGTMLRWIAKEEHTEQYTRARESASDIYETYIIEAAMTVSPETAAADRVKIDALKWVAARRAPKKYGDNQKIDLNVNKLAEMSDEQLDNVIAQATERLKQNG